MNARLRSVLGDLRWKVGQLVEGNVFLRHLLVTRYLYFPNPRMQTFGQFAEDLLLWRLFPEGYRGVFVDVGCFHPKWFNNTFLLYRLGWRGINIDMEQLKIDAFNVARPNDVNICCAITDTPGTVEYFSPGPFSTVSSLHRDHLSSFTRVATKMVAAKTLDQILEASPYRGVKIDVLSIDVEKHDMTVLSTITLDRYQPTVIVVESFAKSLDELVSSDLYKVLLAKEYSLVQWAGSSVIFRR